MDSWRSSGRARRASARKDSPGTNRTTNSGAGPSPSCQYLREASSFTWLRSAMAWAAISRSITAGSVASCARR